MTKRYYEPPISLKQHAMLATLNVSPHTCAICAGRWASMVIEYENLGRVPFMVLEIDSQIVVFINRALSQEE